MSILLRTLLVVAVLALAGQAQAYGLFTCVDAAGREVCVIDTGTATDFSPSQLCNASCPPCAGLCDGAKRYETQSGHWQQTWQGTPGITGNNILVPGASPQGDAQIILEEGLVAPGTPPTLPPAGYPQQAYPGQAYPGQVAPAPVAPNTVAPAPGYQAPANPNYAYPNQAYPNQAYPNQAYPGQSYPTQQYPTQPYPYPAAPDSGSTGS